jgi:hypothetical protein
VACGVKETDFAISRQADPLTVVGSFDGNQILFADEVRGSRGVCREDKAS